MDYWDVIKKRRSIRKFRDNPIPVEIIDAIIETARFAPSGGNAQAWHFGVITDKAVINKLAAAAGNQMWITTAPLLIALCGQVSLNLTELQDDGYGLTVENLRYTPELIEYLKKYPDQRPVARLFDKGNTLLPGEHIVLSAANYGLSSCWIGLLNVTEVSRILNLPAEYACLYLIPIGYADEEPRPVKRKSVEKIAFMNSFENKYHYKKDK
jgi:nitroreductase